MKDMNEQKLSIQNDESTFNNTDGKTDNTNSKEKLFLLAFRGIEALWKVLQIVQSIMQFFQ